MKRLVLLAGFALCFYQCTLEQLEPSSNYGGNDNELLTKGIEGDKDSLYVIERIGDSLFIVENGKHYAVDPDVITVKLKPGIGRIGEDIKELRSNKLGYIDVGVPKDIGVEKFRSVLEERGEFETVEFNTIGEYCFMPNDGRINEQWYLNSINANYAWDITAGNSSVKVAIIDSGVDWNHPDLGVGTDGYSNINASLGWNYITNNNNVITTNYHGTMVAGIIGAKTHNSSRGIAGLAGGKGSAGITMIPYCVGITGPNSAVLDDAIMDAVSKGARVIQLSLGVGSTSAINAAIAYAVNKHVVIVCASGNNGGGTGVGGAVSIRLRTAMS
jgi:thermitase